VAKRIYTEEINKFLTENVNGKTNKEISILLKNNFSIAVTDKAINSHLKKANILRTVRAKRVGLNSMFSKDIRDFINDNSNGVSNQALTEMINTKFSTNYNREQIKNYKQRHKISSGLNGQFEKGIIPFNKGKKMSCEIYDKCKATMFKKGQIPSNHREVDSERITKDGYIEMKIAEPNVWDLKHRVIWRSINGEIGSDDKIVFLDGDPLNINIDNLALITNCELHELNRKGLIKDNADLTKIGILIAKLNITTKIKKRSVK